MTRYFTDGTGGFQTRSDGPLSPPEGWEEITAEEYQTQIAEARTAADAHADEFLAADGELPPPPEGTPPPVIPVDELPIGGSDQPDGGK
ncbi:hypothetical protein [Streptomyces griseofuscus]|uniref:Uncharacterized protein n=1 Tax=Streptomyces griseofuscus TaxID=146922 RepID=A0A7H1Q3S1_9ACTN|nr:hypothetical protein [Streptomyces griseofuscus]QNT94951.1 hypothetical protein HEP81_04679 [Streptomyces griseofuscus]